MIDQTSVDACGESEQTTGWFTMIGEIFAVPFERAVLGVPVIVERVELNPSEEIVVIYSRIATGRLSQSIFNRRIRRRRAWSRSKPTAASILEPRTRWSCVAPRV